MYQIILLGDTITITYVRTILPVIVTLQRSQVHIV